MHLVTVLKSGGDYRPHHVHALARQLAEVCAAPFVCLTDVPVPGIECRPLCVPWLGWWAKMNLFAPEHAEDWLYFDLDTIVRGPIDDLLAVRSVTLLRDFYRPHGLGSGLMVWPQRLRESVWARFTANPAATMASYAQGGDQRFLEALGARVDRWQDVAPGQVVSWKVHCQRGIPKPARVICFHGQPRPFNVPQFAHLYGSVAHNPRDQRTVGATSTPSGIHSP